MNLRKLLTYLALLTILLPLFMVESYVPAGDFIEYEYLTYCIGLDDDYIGVINEKFSCEFTYDEISAAPDYDACNLLVMDEVTNKIIYNISLLDISTIKPFHKGKNITYFDFYVNQEFPIIFNQEGKHIISFSFLNCRGNNEKELLDTVTVHMMSYDNYKLYSSNKEQLEFFKKESEKRWIDARYAKIIAYASLTVAILSLTLNILSFFKATKTILVGIEEKVLSKIGKLFKKKQQKRAKKKKIKK